MRRLLSPTLWVLPLLLALPIPAVAQAQTIFLDDFDDETIGAAPVSPNIGTYSIYPSVGSNTVANPDGNGDLRLRCSDASSGSACVFNFAPTQSPTGIFVTEFVFRIESGFVASGFANDFTQQLVLLPLGNNILVEWAGQGNLLGVRIHSGGQQQEQAFIQNFTWAAGTDYFVEIETDVAANTWELFVDSQSMASGSINATFSGVDRLISKSGTTTTGATQLDDVVITALPEPSAGASMLAALATLAALRRRDSSEKTSRSPDRQIASRVQ